MITHSIEKYAYPVVVAKPHKSKSKKWKGEIGSDEHKLFIFERSSSSFKFKVKEHVVYHRRPAIIMDVIEEFPLVQWSGLKPRFIEIQCDGDLYVVHPSMIRRKR